MSYARSPLFSATGLLYVLASAFLTQNEQQVDQDPRTGKPPMETGASSRGDQLLASWLVVDNENEIALSRLAQERSKNEEVKQFAKQMIDDHQQMVTKLQTIAGASLVGDRGGDRDRGRHQREDGQQPPTTNPPTGTPPSGGHQGGAEPREASGVRESGRLDFVQIKRELAQQCLASARRELEQKSGAEFDKCFMMMQVGAHVMAVDTLEVFKNHASGQLRQTITEALPTVRTHLDHAKTIAKSMEGKSSDAAGTGTEGKR